MEENIRCQIGSALPDAHPALIAYPDSYLAKRHDMTNPTAPVSVIIPCYRCVGTIDRAMQSVARQSMRPTEVILIDDYSGDDTFSRLKELETSFEPGWIKVIALPDNRGPSAARNAGWDAATQPYIAFLDSDDTWHTEKLALQSNLMVNNPAIDLTSHGWIRFEPDCEIDTNPSISIPSSNRMLLRNQIFTSSVMLKRSLPFRFNERKRRSEDYLLWLQILLSGHRCLIINASLAFYYKRSFGQAGLSQSLWLMHRGHADTYHRLYTDNLISSRIHFLLQLWVWLRLARQLAIMGLRRIGLMRD